MKLLILLALVGVAQSWVKEMEDEALFQGDIQLDPDEDERGLNTFASIKGGRWPNARIPYYIDGSIGSGGRSAIAAAIADYHRHTCIRFHQRRSESAYIKFYRGNGCSSPVGYRYGRVNTVSLASGCWYKGTVIHEIGHSIGLYHEQSRPDRDSYIEIQWNNIASNMKYNFDKQRASNINSLGTGYDYRSIMHYGRTAFGNGRLTIRTKDQSMQNVIGKATTFSQIDIKQINLMYCGNTGGGGGGSTGGNGSCSDKVPDCQKNIRGCNQWGQAWVDYMKKYCQKSCNFC